MPKSENNINKNCLQRFLENNKKGRTGDCKIAKSLLKNRLLRFKSHPHGVFGVWHLLKSHFENRHKKPRSLTTSGFFGVASIKDAQYVLYSRFRCHGEKVNRIKGFGVFETVLCASLIDANHFKTLLRKRITQKYNRSDPENDTYPLLC